MERCESVGVGRPDVGAVGNEEWDDLHISDVAGEMERGPASVVFFVDHLGILGNERLDLGQVARPHCVMDFLSTDRSRKNGQKNKEKNDFLHGVDHFPAIFSQIASMLHS